MKITTEKIKLILELHAKYLQKEQDGECADLSYYDLSGSDFSYVDLTGAMFSRSNCSDTNFSYSNLTDTMLTHVNFSGANFSYSNITRANFAYASLPHTDFTGANPTRADFTNANLSTFVPIFADATRKRVLYYMPNSTPPVYIVKWYTFTSGISKNRNKS